MVIKREDLESAGTIVGEEMARHDLDSESWRAWEEAQGGHGTGVRGDGQKSTVKAEPKARGMEENAHQTETTSGARPWGKDNVPSVADAMGISDARDNNRGGGHVSSQGWPSKKEAEAQIAKMKGYDDRDHEVVQDGKWFKIKYGPEKPEPTAGGKLHGVETHTTTDGQRVGKTVMVRAKDKAEAVAKVKSAGHEADSAWEAPDQTGEKYKGLEHVGDDKAGTDPLDAWGKKWPFKVTRHENGTISVPDQGKDEAHRAALWRMPGYRVTSVSGGTIWLDKKSKDDAKSSKAKPRGIEDPTGGYPLVEARKKQVRDAARKAKKG